MHERAVHERALGAYLGLAVGDALGATVEFMTRAQIARVHGVHRRIVGGGWLNLPAGAVTDDTQMSLALGEAITRAQAFDLREVAEAFAAWLRGRPVDCGHTCRRGIRRFMRDGSLAAPLSPGDAGNGALMRNLPVVLCSYHDDHLMRERTLAQCHITHNHPYSDAAAIYLGRMTGALLRGEGRESALAWSEALVREHSDFAYVGYDGKASAYVVDTVRTVLSAFGACDTFEHALVTAVNRGDDADTTGALTGMLAGAHYGWRAIPRTWLDKLDRSVRRAIEAQVPALLSLASQDVSA